ncbi:ABC transporter ATP-binding protein [Pseudobacter ginsenosidimutans]|uniref:ABC-2 type transport system ATP-binding protein n=1 Tax=Pseudobacter ginsenosidimutans TaxID=661488 RepID=A0A4Q7MQL6_9BACT|nr:ABC transporter ATP-binding protein [Pseudobacter ginsenosidimutans]RZS71005.1 ABC-2 type transport system ATP-binding protein [Pseudobacter ginsenosidimutans]
MILKTENLSHRYGASWAIRDINIEIAEHGIIGLLGSNGAGKSTTMNIICGVLNQTEGKVSINGADIRKEPELAKQHIGFLPQTPPVYLDLTVDEYLTYTAELRLIPGNRIKEAVAEAKERTGIAHFSKRLIKNLSGGYRQRVGISQAIIHKPKLVVMDEPTNGLDPNQLIEARKLIREIAQDRTVLLSSHILSEIHLLCKEVIMIESGRIIFSDSMDAFNNYMQPQSVLVSFVNPPSVNELKQIDGVNQVEYITEKQARLFFDGAEDLTERIIAAGMQQNWRIREVGLEKGMLDDIFKQLSTQSNKNI